MIRKTMTAVTVAGALALGTASATSLGSFNNPTFAASGVELLDCSVTGDLLDLIPDLPAVGETVSDFSTSTLAAPTFDLESVDVSALLTALDALPAECLVGKVLDIVLLAGSDVVATIQVTDLAGTPLVTGVPTGTDVVDVVSVTSVRAVLTDA